MEVKLQDFTPLGGTFHLLINSLFLFLTNPFSWDIRKKGTWVSFAPRYAWTSPQEGGKDNGRAYLWECVQTVRKSITLQG